MNWTELHLKSWLGVLENTEASEIGEQGSIVLPLCLSRKQGRVGTHLVIDSNNVYRFLLGPENLMLTEN